MKSDAKSTERIHRMTFARVYPMYIQKAEKKGRTKTDVDQIIRWQTGYTAKGLGLQLKKQSDMEAFFAAAPRPNPKRQLVSGVICGVRVEEIKDTVVREVRILDKLIDELAKGRMMEKILREE